MRRLSHIIIVVMFAAQCASADSTTKPSTQPMPTDTISTTGFDVSLPRGWKALPSDSKPGMVVFQSPDDNIRLTVSVALDIALNRKDAAADLAKICEVRRQAETQQARHLRLSDIQSANGDRMWSRSWRGSDSEVGRLTATFVELAKSKLFILYLEAFDTADADLNKLADQVFGSMTAK